MAAAFVAPIEREIWVTIRAFNDAWTKGKPDYLARIFHPQRVAVAPYARLRLDGAEACIAGWAGFAEAAHPPLAGDRPADPRPW